MPSPTGSAAGSQSTLWIRSLQGLFKITRHRIRRFPTFLIGGREKYTGWDLEELVQRIEARLAQTVS